MKKSLIFPFLATILALTFAACDKAGQEGGDTPEPTPEEVVYDVYLFLGQSNMSGFGGDMLPGDEEPIPNVFQLDDQGEILPAGAPLNFFSSVRKRIAVQKVNPAFQFAKVMSEKSKNPVLIVCNARGGTTLAQWSKGASLIIRNEDSGDDPWLWGVNVSLYDEAVRRCKQALEYGNLKAICWHQGCGDSQSQAVMDKYLENLNKFVTNLRADVGVGEEVPFIAGELQYKAGGAPRFNPIIQTIGDVVKGGHWVSAEGVTICGDGIHFDRAGQILIGGRYADKVLELLDVEKEDATE